MKTFIINIFMLILGLAFLLGFIGAIIPIAIVELLFWLVCDTKFGWLFKITWDLRKVMRFI